MNKKNYTGNRQSTDKHEMLPTMENKFNAISEDITTITQEVNTTYNSLNNDDTEQLTEKQVGIERADKKKMGQENQITTKDLINKSFEKLVQGDKASMIDHKPSKTIAPSLEKNQLASGGVR